MYKYLFIYSVFLNIVLSDPFFSLSDKPIFFCLKVCPLYCPKRRSDEDAASLIYLEDSEDSPYTFSPDADVWVEEDPTFTPYPYPYGHIIYKPLLENTTLPPTTTTMKTTTTTKASNYICDLCKSKCNYPKS